MQYLIIGGGVAGTTAAGELRRLDNEANITIISDEKHTLYSRVMLRNYIAGTVPRERLFLKSKDWYDNNGIDLVFDTVTKLHTDTKTVKTESGHVYNYDKLLIAGGGTLNKLPCSNEEGSYHLQTIEDADKLVALLKEHGDTKREAHIIGGSFIAMDFVEMFARNDLKTTVHLRVDRYFSKSLDKESSTLIESQLKLHDVKTRHNSTVTHKAEVGQDSILGIGVGLGCRFDWTQGSDVEIKDGVVANEYLETNAKDVWTAGDCALFNDLIIGRVHRIGNWTNAQMQGRHAAKNMAGAREPFKLLSSYSMPVLKLPIVMIGDATIGQAEDIIVRGDTMSRTQLFVRHGRVIGATLINRNHERGIITKMITEQTPVSSLPL